MPEKCFNLPDQLQTAAERGEIGEAAHLVEAVQQLSAHFQGYASIPKVAELSGRLQALQSSLQARSPASCLLNQVACYTKTGSYWMSLVPSQVASITTIPSTKR